MLYFIATWTFLIIVCCTIGVGLLNFLQANSIQRMGDRFIIALWLGVIALAISLLFVSLVLPLSPGAGIGVAGILSTSVLLIEPTRQELNHLKVCLTKSRILLYCISATLVAAATTGPVIWIDAGLYFYSVIQWLANFGTVPGLALLFANFGFTSSWFALNAPFNPALLDARVSAVLGGFVLLIGVIQVLVGSGYYWKGKAQFSDWFLVLFSVVLLSGYAILPPLPEIAVSASPDVPTSFLAGVVPWSILVVKNSRRSEVEVNCGQTRAYAAIVPLILGIGATTIKLTAMPLLLIGSLFYMIENRKKPKALWGGWLIATLIFLPFLIAQIFSSGCPLFPSNLWCINTAWTVAPEKAEYVAKATHDWTSWYSSNSSDTVLSLSDKFLIWLLASRINLLMIAGILGSLVLLIFCFSLLRKTRLRGYIWVIATQVIGIAFYLKTSLFLRFMFPYLVLTPVLVGAAYSKAKLEHLRPKVARLMHQWFSANSRAFIMTALFLILASTGFVLASDSISRLVLPAPLKQVKVVPQQTNNITYFAPQDDLCWTAPLPCAFDIPADVYLRQSDRGIAGGFIRQD